MLCTALCSTAPAIVLVIGGGYQTFISACDAVEAKIPVLVFADSGKAADFIAATYYNREQPLVGYHKHCMLF